MVQFVQSGITNAGKDLLAKVQVNQTAINFTKMAAGSGEMPPGGTVEETTELYNKIMDLQITKLQINEDNSVTVGSILNNTGLESGFEFRELGLYAEDPDLGEILYCYGNAADAYDFIPPASSGIVEQLLDIITSVGDAEVTAVIESGLYATHEDLANLHTEINADISNLETNKLDKTGDASNVTNTFTQTSTRANLVSGENQSTIFGKLMKWFADLKPVAWSGNASDLTEDASNRLVTDTEKTTWNGKLDKSGGTLLGDLDADGHKIIDAHMGNIQQRDNFISITLDAPDFADGVDKQRFVIVIPKIPVYSCELRVKAIGSQSHVVSAGILTKTLTLYIAENIIHSSDSSYTNVEGRISERIAISELVFSEQSNSFLIEIQHIDSSATVSGMKITLDFEGVRIPTLEEIKTVSFSSVYTNEDENLPTPVLQSRGKTVWTEDTDGVGSGLDADKFQGQDLADFSYFKSITINDVSGFLLDLGTHASSLARFTVEIFGSGHGAGQPIKTQLNWYQYDVAGGWSNKIQLNHGLNIGECKLMTLDGKTVVWVPNTAQYQEFNVTVLKDTVNITSEITLTQMTEPVTLPRSEAKKLGVEPQEITNKVEFPVINTLKDTDTNKLLRTLINDKDINYDDTIHATTPIQDILKDLFDKSQAVVGTDKPFELTFNLHAGSASVVPNLSNVVIGFVNSKYGSSIPSDQVLRFKLEASTYGGSTGEALFNTNKCSIWGNDYYFEWEFDYDNWANVIVRDAIGLTESTSFLESSTEIATVISASDTWRRIAASPINIGQCYAKFRISMHGSPKYCNMDFIADIMDSAPPIITVLSKSYYSYDIPMLRIVYNETPTGNYAYLEYYSESTGGSLINVEVTAYDQQGWSLVSPDQEGSIPSGYIYTELQTPNGISTTGSIYSQGSNEIHSTSQQLLRLYYDGSYRANGGNITFHVEGGHRSGTVGHYYVNTPDIHLLCGDNSTAYGDVEIHALSGVVPLYSNEISLGTASNRWTAVYAYDTTINLADIREKQQISTIPDEWLDAWETVKCMRYKWNDAVAEKSDENARWHIGVSAQDIQQAFLNHNVDAFKIGLLCYDEWDEKNREVADTKTIHTREAGNSFSVRPDECQFLELALQRRETKRLQDAVKELQVLTQHLKNK